MGIANIVNTAGGGGGSSEIITHLVNSVDGAGLRLANQGYISCADVSANRFGTNDFSVEFVLSQETNAINADIFISNLNGSNQAVDAAVIRWDVIQNDNIQLVFTNSGAAETAYNFGYDPAPDLNEPTHYLVSADRSGNAVLYRNGAEIASVSIAASGSANVGNSGQPTVIGSPVNNFGVKGNVYRFRTYSKALSSDEAKNVFDRADVPTALVSNLLLDLDCAYANPTQSTVIQDRGPNNQDGTLNGTITQTNVIKQLNSTSARIGTTQATPADGDIIVSGGVGVGAAAGAGGHGLTVDKVVNDDWVAKIKNSGNTTPYGLQVDCQGSNAVTALAVYAGSSPNNTTFTIKPSGVIVGDTPNAISGGIPDLHVNRTDGGTLVLSRTNGDNNGALGTVRFGNTDTDSTLANIIATEAGTKTSSKLEFQTQTTGAAAATRLTIGSDGLCTFANGIAFPAPTPASAGTPAASSVLDVYEEGTWTPVLNGVTGGNSTGVYTRIGNMCYFAFYSGSITSTAVDATFSGLPFTCSAYYGTITATHNTWVPNADSGYVAVSTTTGKFTPSASISTATAAAASGRYIMFSGYYRVA